MRAALTVGPRRIVVVDVPEPRPSPHDALVDVVAVGLCGTDLHMWAGERAGVGFPLRQGHEIGAVVRALPTDGSGGSLRVGDVVAVDPYFPCGRCRTCRRGDWSVCPDFTAYGVALDGGLVETMAVPASHLHVVPAGSAELAALVEPVAVAAMALERAGVGPGDRIVVVGAGPIGLSLVLCARHAGLDVLVADVLPARLGEAEALGAAVGIDVGRADLAAAVRGWTGGHGADAVFEASGAPDALGGAPGLLGRGATLVLVGLTPGEVSIPVSRVLFEGIRVVGARAGLFPAAVEVVRADPGAVARLVSHRYPLDDVAAALTHAHDRPQTTGKVLVIL